VDGISDIRIAGMDENRPPRLRKEPYINILSVRRNMKYLHVLLIGLCFVQSSQAYSGNPKLEYDSVSIGHIPSKVAHHQGVPHVVLEAKALAHHKNNDIEKFFIALNDLASEGRTDNATQFHVPTIYIEAIYQEKRVRLFFSGDSNLDKFKRYEKQWKLLHSEIFKYLNTEVSPNYQFNTDGAKNSPPVN
jgi:hypothetical protein